MLQWRCSMKNVLIPASFVIFAVLAATPVAAQQRGTVSVPHMVTPPGSVSLSTPQSSPLQQQMQDNYATQLRQTQRDLLQQNPSGVTRPEVAIGHQLNGFTPQ